MDILNLDYFNSSIWDSPFELNNDIAPCSICKKDTSHRLELDGSIEIIYKGIEVIETVCLNCLSERKYGFEHQVEGGFLTKDGILTESEKYKFLKNSDDYSLLLQPKEEQLLTIEKSKMDNLIHTPPFNAYQGARWLIHCNDFMKFIGTWEHDDFVKHSPNNNAKIFFNEIVDNWNGDDFYDKQFGPNKSKYAESAFYAFECLHCKQQRGYVE
ncbi:CbrC family protein [uncultured Nonlabens sp.]|uniref:CbrC family protein n=1 Tax=uncultured Nonlabens sp. TaxID=859306 RepID=UPI0026310112|nr:CbrC family protein [uncultured Nonlabens sp.]